MHPWFHSTFLTSVGGQFANYNKISVLFLLWYLTGLVGDVLSKALVTLELEIDA